MTTTLGKLTTQIEKRQQDKRALYEALVVQCANGAEPDPTKADAILKEAGMDVAKLQDDVERLQERRTLAATLAREPSIEQELGSIEKELAAAANELEKHQSAHNQAVNPLLAERERLLAERLDLHRARARLLELAPPEVRNELKSIPQRQARLREKLRAADSDLQRFGADLQNYEHQHQDRPTLLPVVTRHEEERRAAEFRERSERAIERAKERIRELQTQLRETTEREAALYEQSITVD